MHTKTIRQYYVLSCLFNAGGLQIISAIYVTFLMRNGLNLFEVNVVNASFFLTLFLCEIPTGAFADIFGRKTSFVFACLLMCVSMFVYGNSRTLFGFICAEVLAGIGLTFRSGAFQAWLVDSLKHQGYVGEYSKIFGREGLLKQIFGGISAVVGSYLSARNSTLPWFLGAIIMGVTTIIAYATMKEEYFVRSVFSWKKGFASMRDITVSSIHYGLNHKAVRFILVITCVQIFAVQALNMYWQPFFRNYRVSEAHMGFLFVGMMASLAFGAFLASKMKNGENEKKVILASQVWAGLFVILIVLVPGLPFVVVLFMLHEMPRGFWNPMIDSYLQKRIPSRERATVSSFCSIAPHIGGAIGLLASGAIAELFGISVAWAISGIVLVGSAVIVSKNGCGAGD